MTDFNLTKSLDPRLRRLVRSMNDPERLRSDRERAFVTAAPEAPDTAPEQFSKRVLVQVDRDELPAEFAALQWHRLADGVYSVSVPVTRLEELARHPHVKFVESGRRMTAALDTSVPAATVDVVHAPPAGTGLHGSGVVVGVIDMGFDFTLDDFTTGPGGSTRIAFLWDQSLTPQGSESAPAEFGYGVEYTAKDIDAARPTADPFLHVRHKPDMGAHGTHVTGIAAGNGASADAEFAGGKYVGVADAATLILVHPGIETGARTLADSAHVADAVDYIFRRAANQPCVINLSLGQNGGSHDGESIVERAIDRLLDKTGRALVVAAGNEHIWRTHASGTLTTTAPTQTLKWRVGAPPAGFPTVAGAVDRTPNELEIWYSSRDAFSVRVVDPAGHATSTVTPDNSATIDLGGNRVYVDSERFTTLNGDARIYIEISSGTATAIQSGTWRVELSAVELHAGRFDAWIERTERNFSNGYSDQSSFEDGNFDPSMTLGTPATARRAIAVANYDHRLTEISGTSGRGPTRDRREKPECSAPGTSILSTCALGARSQNGSVVPVRAAMSGTSMAAPHVTGVVALLFERALALSNPVLLSAEQARKLIMAATSPAPGVVGYDPAWGFGRLDAEAAVRILAQ